MPKNPDRRPPYDELAALVVRQMTRSRPSGRRSSGFRLGRNSENSSLPPSRNTFVQPDKKPPVKSGNKRGRQPGAPGAGLAMVENPDQVEEHVPGVCGNCGKILSTLDSVGFTRRLVRDIPLVTLTVTEYQVHRCRCDGCGRVSTAALPDQVAGAPSSYGPNLRALAAYLLVFQHISVERCAQLIATSWEPGSRPAGFPRS
ncbi:hypothetical protein [Nonomuraea sp. NPDC049400]|uniref:hypothetical protein n=1 Tax=Nonomuraea sp. NPDC049400 TaxID=3364352 RepID=UPI0037A7BEF7